MDGEPDSVVALIAIHPRYAEAILDGSKEVEFRRASYASRATHVALYATSPVRRIVGVFAVNGVDRGTPAEVWSRHSGHGGVSKAEFSDYFAGAPIATAICVGEARRLGDPLSLATLDPSMTPPQSVKYLNRAVGRRILQHASWG
jgi:predicted transcriptional regulator